MPEEAPVTKTTFFIIKKMASYLHHTATTEYLCCVPTLEDLSGASCVGLAKANILILLETIISMKG